MWKKSTARTVAACARKKGAPAIVSHGRGRDPVRAQDLADGAGADPAPQAAQFALDPDHAQPGLSRAS